jgi:hypothetical protein
MFLEIGRQLKKNLIPHPGFEKVMMRNRVFFSSGLLIF